MSEAEDRVNHTWLVLHDQSATNRNSSVKVKGSTKCRLTGTAACFAACCHISIIDTVATGFVICNAVMISFDKVLLCCRPPFLSIGYCCAAVFGDLIVDLVATAAHRCVCAPHQEAMTHRMRHQHHHKCPSKPSWHGQFALPSTLQQRQSFPSECSFGRHTLFHICPEAKQLFIGKTGGCTFQETRGRKVCSKYSVGQVHELIACMT